MSNRPLARDEPGRGFGQRRDEEPRGSDSSRPNNAWSRPPSRSYRPGPAQSHTPSPPRRFEPLDSRRGFGPGPGPRDRDRDWDNSRRWGNDRDRERDRFRDYSPPRGRRPSPPRTHSPPRGPRALNAQPTSYTPTPRIPPISKSNSYQGRDIRFDRPGTGGPGPTTLANQSQSQSIPPPRAPRSMRGSSSPVESRNTWSQTGPSSVPTQHVELPVVSETQADGDDDLEEGEVVSPVRKTIEPPLPPRSGMGDRWAPSRRSLSPRRRRMLSRPGSPEFRNRSRDRGWRNSRRSMSPVISKPIQDQPPRPIPRHDPPPTIANTVPIPRPPTPPVVSALHAVKPPPRPETPILPENPPRGPSPVKPLTSRPKTPELPMPPKVEPPTEQEVAAVTSAAAPSIAKESRISPAKEAPLEVRATAPVETPVAKPSLSLDTYPRGPLTAFGPSESAKDARHPQPSQPAQSDIAPSPSSPVHAVPPLSTISNTENTQDEVTADTVLRTPISAPVYQTTIAERRAVRLPESVTLTSRMRQDSMPSARSASSQPETPQTAEPRDDDPLDGDLSDGALEEIYQANIVAAVARSQKVSTCPDFDSIFSWNEAAAPPLNSRETVLVHHSEVTEDLEDTEEETVDKVSRYVERETRQRAAKMKDLRLDYRDHAADWAAQHRLLTDQMKPRGPLPENVLYIPDKDEPTDDQPDASGTDGSIGGGRRGNYRRDGLVANSDEAMRNVMLASSAASNRDPVAQSWVNKAAIPDMELDGTWHYDDENDLVRNPLEFYDFDGVQEKIWTPEERAIFRRLFPGSFKQFGKIADKLPDKTVGDCVQYYYRTKKDLDWKGLVNKKSGGGKKPKPPPLIKSKGPTLLNNVDKAKAASGPAAGAGGRSTITPARKGQGPRIRETVAGTPVDTGNNRRRKQTALDAIEGPGSDATSRAGSEAPATVKSKMRMSIKGKRPRVSSVTGTTMGQGSALVEGQEAPGDSVLDVDSSAPTPTRLPGDPQAELLPPAKRAGKRRKVTDGTGPPEDKGDRPKRQSTSSYWSVEEKKAVGKLLAMYPDDFEKIAEHIAGKSVRQVQNFIASRGDMPDAGPVLSTSAYPYDVASQQPRLGTFNDNQPASPTKSQFRPGGMRISNLLNDDTADSARPGSMDTMDAASDGTVEDEGMTRPPSRSVPPRPNSTGASFDRPGPSSSAYPEHYQRPYPGYQSQPLPPSQHHPGQPPPAGYYSGPSSRPYSQTGWDYPAPPPRQHQHQQPHPGLPPPSLHAQHQHAHAHGHQYPHGYPPQSHRPGPQMGTFAPVGRTIYDQNRERGRIAPPAPPPPQKDRNRSEGPAFTGFAQEPRST